MSRLPPALPAKYSTRFQTIDEGTPSPDRRAPPPLIKRATAADLDSPHDSTLPPPMPVSSPPSSPPSSPSLTAPSLKKAETRRGIVIGSAVVAPAHAARLEFERKLFQTATLGMTDPADRLTMDLGRKEGFTFANSLTHNFDAVSNQVGVGIKKTKSLTLLMQSIVEIKREAAQKILLLIDREQRQLQPPEEEIKEHAKRLFATVTRDPIINAKGRDQMQRFGGVYDQTLAYLRREAQEDLQETTRLEKDVILPLTNHNSNNDSRLLSLAKTEKECRTEMADASKNIKKTHEICATLLQFTIQAKLKDPDAPQTIEPTKEGEKKNFLSKVTHKIQKGQLISPKKLQKMAFAAAEVYEQAIKDANNRQTKFYTIDLPLLFTQLESLERSRLMECSRIITKLAEAKVLVNEPKKQYANDLLASTKILDTSQDMLDFLTLLLSTTGFPPDPVPYTYNLPCTSADIFKGRFEKKDSYFGNTLENIMLMQESQYPGLPVPFIVESCIKSCIAQNGPLTEGIFRVSIPKDELDNLVTQFDSSRQISGENPHASACVLKQWFRSLESPLIPASMYERAIVMGGEPCNTVKMEQFITDLPKINREVLHRVSYGLIAEILKPANLAKNLMSLRALAIVFAPGFLRNSSDDPMEMLNNAKFETQFTMHLFETLLGKIAKKVEPKAEPKVEPKVEEPKLEPQ